MDHLRIDVTGAPESGFSLYGAARFLWTVLIAFLVGTMLGIPAFISERYEYAVITYAIALIAWCWWVLVRPLRSELRMRAYDRSLREIRIALRKHRSGAHGARGVWLALNLSAAAGATVCAAALDSAYRDAAGVLAIALGLNGLRLWADKSNFLKTALAWTLIVAIWLGALILWNVLFGERQNDGGWIAIAGVIAIPALTGVAIWLTQRISPLSQATMAEMRARDRRAPVLFLRSFEDEAEPILSRGGPKLETVLTASARPYGPFIAIGKPGELRPAGAARTYFAHDAWQAAALGLMDEAAFIVAAPGLTPGLDWEMQRIAERGRLRKTIFVLPPQGRQARIERLRALLAETPEGARLREIDLSTTMALHLTRDWRWANVCSGYISYAEYQAAVDVAVYGLLCADR